MSRVLLLDLGETLIHGTTAVLPHVQEALAALAEFKGDNGKPLQRALVSDTEMPSPPPTPAKIKPIFDGYVATLTTLQLRSFFEPVSKHVTLSAHARVLKPDRKVFALAVKRLGVTAKLTECVFVTENADHIRHCREQLGMKTLQFGKDFTDWADGPCCCRRWSWRHGEPGRGASARGLSRTRQHLADRGGQALSTRRRRCGADIGRRSRSGSAHVPLPVRIDLPADAHGRITPVSKAFAEDIEGGASCQGLVARVKSGTTPDPSRPIRSKPTTGGRLLKRRGFEAFSLPAAPAPNAAPQFLAAIHDFVSKRHGLDSMPQGILRPPGENALVLHERVDMRELRRSSCHVGHRGRRPPGYIYEDGFVAWTTQR